MTPTWDTSGATPASTASWEEATSRLFASVQAGPSEFGVDWQQVELDLGTALPPDYRAICNRFGPGVFDDELALACPGEHGGLEHVGYATAVADMHREMRDDALIRAQPPFPVFPEPGGALAWGRVPTGLNLCWATTGDPAEWSVVIVDDDSVYIEYWVYGGTMGQFLLDVTTAVIQVPWLEESGYSPGTPPRFAPART